MISYEYRTYGVMLDDHTVQQGPDSIEATHIQTCQRRNAFCQHLLKSLMELSKISMRAVKGFWFITGANRD